VIVFCHPVPGNPLIATRMRVIGYQGLAAVADLDRSELRPSVGGLLCESYLPNGEDDERLFLCGGVVYVWCPSNWRRLVERERFRCYVMTDYTQWTDPDLCELDMKEEQIRQPGAGEFRVDPYHRVGTILKPYHQADGTRRHSVEARTAWFPTGESR